MAYPQTQVPNTRHTVFYSHTIQVGGVNIGSFERLSIRASRNTERIREILFKTGPEVVEIVWGGTDISIDLSRVEMYTLSLYEAFGFDIYSIEDFNQPIQVMEIQKNPTNSSKRIIHYTDCVPSSWSKDIDTGTVRTVESMTLEVRTITGKRE